MNGPGLQDKRIFLIVSSDGALLDWMAERLPTHVTNPTIFRAGDGLTAIAKFQNAPPNVVITHLHLPKLDGLKMVDQALAARGSEASAFIIVGQPPDQEQHLDEIVTGRVQYLTNERDEQEFTACVMRALNYSSQHEKAEFHVRFLAAGDQLLKEGEKADFVYFVKKGRLEAARRSGGKNVVLGNIEYGEFVGEMAYINGEPRSADVTAVTDCELIEVPLGRFEKVLFKRPSWSKALMMTLSKRVKKANESKSPV